MRAGDKVATPRFCTVTIKKIFPSEKRLRENGYTEPTHLTEGDYQVLGKSIDIYHMEFAAAVRDSIKKKFLALAGPDEKGDFVELLDSAEPDKKSVNVLCNRTFEHLECLGNYEDEYTYRLWLFSIDGMPGCYISLYDCGNGWYVFYGFVPEDEKERIENGDWQK